MKRYKPIIAGVVTVIICLVFYIRSPKQQARSMLVEAVGEEYFELYMEFEGVEYNFFDPEEWLTRVEYDYLLQVGNYSVTHKIYIFFDWVNRLHQSIGLPSSNNLMPFNVSREKAISIALEQVTQRYLEAESKILFVRRSVNDVPLNRYVWHVCFYLTEKSALSGSLIEVLIDLHSGEVFNVGVICWSTD